MVTGLLSHGLRNTTEILFRRQESITQAAALIILLSLASRILGVIRFRVLAGQFGSDSPELAAFLAAFRIPDIVFQILVLGALATAFIPVVTSYLSKSKEQEAWRIFSVVVTYALAATAAFSVVVFFLAEPIAGILTPGFRSQPEILRLTADMIRLLMVAQFFLVSSNFVTGVLNSYHRFLIPAIAPVVYNLGVIGGTIFLSPYLGIYGPVLGVIVGALGHLVIQLPLLSRLGVIFRPSLQSSLPGVREVGRLMGPRAFGLAVAQVDYITDTALASLVSSATTATNIIVFNYAFALQALPAGVFGYALGVATLPTLAKEYAEEQLDNFKSTLITSLHQILYLVIPVVVVLFVLRIPIVRLIYGAPSFDWEATKLTALTLAAFSIGIVGQSAIQLLARGFYALHDTKTPVKISILTVLVNVALSISLVYFFNNVVFLGLAATIAGSLDALLLLYFLAKKVGGLPWRMVLIPAIKMILAGVFAGLALYIPLKVLDSSSYGQLWLQGSIVNTYFGAFAIDTSHTAGLLLLTLISGALGLLVYFLITYILGVEEIAVFVRLLTHFKPTRLKEPLKRDNLTTSPDGEHQPSAGSS